MRVRVRLRTMGPRLAVHAHSWPLRSGIAKTLVEGQGTGSRIAVDDKKAVLTVLARVQHDAAAIGVGCNPVGQLLVIKGDAGDLADVVQIGDVVSSQRVSREQGLNPLVRRKPPSGISSSV